MVKDRRRLGRQKIKIEALDLEHSMNYVHDLFLSVGVGVRALVEEAATLASLALFLGMIAIWAQASPRYEALRSPARLRGQRLRRD